VTQLKYRLDIFASNSKLYLKIINQSIYIKNIIICVINIIIFIIIRSINIKKLLFVFFEIFNIIIYVINIIIFIIINNVNIKNIIICVINITIFYIINFYNKFYKNKK